MNAHVSAEMHVNIIYMPISCVSLSRYARHKEMEYETYLKEFALQYFLQKEK